MVQRAKVEGEANYVSVTIKRAPQTIIPEYNTASVECRSGVMEKIFGKFVSNVGND